MKKIITWSVVVVGGSFIVLSIYYFVTPAGYLPHFLPGFEANSPHIHFKHGLACLILGVFALIFAWFWSAPGLGNQESSTNA